jgi:hypothetical protein
MCRPFPAAGSRQGRGQHGRSAARAQGCAQAKLSRGKKALAKAGGDVGSWACNRSAFRASPPDIEARPWRVLVFLGCCPPLGCSCAARSRGAAGHAIVPDSWPWGNLVSASPALALAMSKVSSPTRWRVACKAPRRLCANHSIACFMQRAFHALRLRITQP